MTRRDDAMREGYISLARLGIDWDEAAASFAAGITYSVGGLMTGRPAANVDHLPADALTNDQLIQRIRQECPRPEPVCACADPEIVSNATYADPTAAICARCGRRYIDPEETA